MNKSINNIKIAIIHDWLNTFTGAEKVLEQIVHLFPNADLFTVVDFLGAKKILNINKVKTSFIQHIPFARKYYRQYLPLMPYAVGKFNLSDYDLILSSSHAVAKGVKTHERQLHICYIHTPIRYAWDLRTQYLLEANYKGLKKILANYILDKIRVWDYNNSSGVDYFISNSKYIRSRVKRCYGRDSHVIYPPVDIDSFKLTEKKEDYFLTASRFVPYKKVNLIVEAFTKIPNKRLLVIGDGPDAEKIKKIAGNNVIFKGFLEQNKLIEYMQNAKAFIFAAEEDFGIMPVEVQACGTPVIAYGKGGALETVINGQTGLLFSEQTIESLVDAIDRLELQYTQFDPQIIRQNAERFSIEIFRKKYFNFVKTNHERSYN